jgi:hypothetical protein
MWKSIALSVGLITLVAPTPVLAQDDEGPNRWGVSVSFAPNWKVPEGDSPFGKLAEVALTAGDLGYDVSGADFRIGVVRGRHLQGDWGVSYVRRTFKEGSTQGGILTECEQNNCFTYGEEFLYQDASVTGIEANKFIGFGTIANRVQIGVDIAIGVGWYQKTVERREASTDFLPPNFNTPVVTISSEQVPATQLSPVDPSLLGRAEIAAAVVVTQGLKVRISGGMNYPGTHAASVSLMYFFGSAQ